MKAHWIVSFRDRWIVGAGKPEISTFHAIIFKSCPEAGMLPFNLEARLIISRWNAGGLK